MALRKHGAGGAGRRRVFVVDDHPVLREGLAQIINRQSDLEVCGFAETAAAALDGISTASPDLVIVDISLKGGDGLGLIGELRRRDPGLHLLVLSMHDESIYAERLLSDESPGNVSAKRKVFAWRSRGWFGNAPHVNAADSP